MTDTDILWLGQQACGQRLLVGAKSANLSKICSRYTIPPGFSVPSSFFKKFDTYPMDKDKIAAELSNSVSEAYIALGKKCECVDPSVAIRSSAIDEDNKQASFAGQFKTFLNISGIDTVIPLIIDCYQSAFSDQVLAYRKDKGIDVNYAMSVFIQHFIHADMSSVVFSKNPMNDDTSEIIINANWGLGESIVSGNVTPDTYIIDKNSLTIKQKMIAKKLMMTITNPGNGIQDVEIPKIMADTPVMTDEQIIENARFAQQLETDFNMYVDIECAWKNEKLYLLQCRPVTTSICKKG
ncbi:MAG: PEP/pyruvate-binding domain-containing protein [Candidatus Magnetomorum sp.]|nr:PEP/pyruvate-binding domain-containing protein [Candidatus Magnetomorum sp.]